MEPQARNRIYYANPQERLNGFIPGYKGHASDIEERFWRSLARYRIPNTYRFRVDPILGFTLVRNNVLGALEVDFLCQYNGQIKPINIDGQIAHFAARWMLEFDAEKTAKINEAMKKINAQPMIRVPYFHLRNQAMADRQVQDIFLSPIPIRLPEPVRKP